MDAWVDAGAGYRILTATTQIL